MSEMTDDEMADWAAFQILKDPAKRSAPCCVCGGKADLIGVYCPSQAIAKRIGQPKGKRRFVGYAICSECVQEPGNADRVEEAIIRDMGVH